MYMIDDRGKVVSCFLACIVARLSWIMPAFIGSIDFVTSVSDSYDSAFALQAIQLQRHQRCSICCCLPCCLQRIDVYAPPGNPVGSVVQEWSCCASSFTIRDAGNSVAFNMRGPLCKLKGIEEVSFTMTDGTTGALIGKITRLCQGPGLQHIKEQQDQFVASFPQEIDVGLKACILAAAILIDFMFFENTQPPAEPGKPK